MRYLSEGILQNTGWIRGMVGSLNRGIGIHPFPGALSGSCRMRTYNGTEGWSQKTQARGADFLDRMNEFTKFLIFCSFCSFCPNSAFSYFPRSNRTRFPESSENGD
jgi:hypothetical protein